jgi:hypothetical protein
MLPQQQLHYKKGALFSTRCVPRCYKQKELEVSDFSKEFVGELVG